MVFVWFIQANDMSLIENVVCWQGRKRKLPPLPQRSALHQPSQTLLLLTNLRLPPWNLKTSKMRRRMKGRKRSWRLMRMKKKLKRKFLHLPLHHPKARQVRNWNVAHLFRKEGGKFPNNCFWKENRKLFPKELLCYGREKEWECMLAVTAMRSLRTSRRSFNTRSLIRNKLKILYWNAEQKRKHCQYYFGYLDMWSFKDALKESFCHAVSDNFFCLSNARHIFHLSLVPILTIPNQGIPLQRFCFKPLLRSKKSKKCCEQIWTNWPFQLVCSHFGTIQPFSLMYKIIFTVSLHIFVADVCV